MAKDRHRFFEIYESRDEAAWEVMPKTHKVVTPIDESENWTFSRIVVSQLAGITQVKFNDAELTGQDVVTRIEEDLLQLADKLGGDSRVLMDFTGVHSINQAGINALMAFTRKLKVRGSRMVLCCLEPDVRAVFFVPS